jgi:nucleotide-binding universal stress UspA family protein
MKPDTDRVVIVAAIDRTAASDSVVYTATGLARAISGAELHFVHVIVEPPTNALSPLPMGELLHEGRTFLDEVMKQAEAKFAGRIVGHLGVGSAQKQILQLASDLEADLIVVGSHNKGALARMMLGSVSQAVVNKAQCAVLVARPKDYVTNIPEIEPPCPKCVEVQRATGGEKLWCEQHATKHPRPHLHYATPAPFAVGSMLLRHE